MSVLAYNYDNGFVSEQAKLNLKRITDALGVDLVTIKHDQTKYFRNNLMALSKKFSPAMVPTLCLGRNITKLFKVQSKINEMM
jgi:hypothetical protein